MAKFKKEIQEKEEKLIEKIMHMERNFLFTDVILHGKHGVVIKATSQEEAIKKLHDLLSNQK